jgi:hypothetical protein
MPWICNNARYAQKEQVALRVIQLEAFDLSSGAARAPRLYGDEALAAAAEAGLECAVSVPGAEEECGLCSFVRSASLEALGPTVVERARSRGYVLLYARTHAQFVLRAQLHEGVPLGSIALNPVQRLNLEVTYGPEPFPFSEYDPAEEGVRALASVVLELRPRFSYNRAAACGRETVCLDAGAARALLGTCLQGFIVTQHERMLVSLLGRQYFVRVKEVEAEEPDNGDEQDGDGAELRAKLGRLSLCGISGSASDDQVMFEERASGAERELLVEDVWRGAVAAGTMLYLDRANGFDGDLELANASETRPVKSAVAQPDVIDVYCADGEWFPVKKRLLRPCIALAPYVLSTSAQQRDSVLIALDCCVFDQVLRFLLAEARGERFAFDMDQCEPLLHAARELRLPRLQRQCEEALGNFRSSVRDSIPWAEVQARNAKGELLLIIDDCVIDVTEWIDMHPGGREIIPAQAINVDATVMFEVYHVTRDSFSILRQLYVGQLRAEDRALVPPPPHVHGRKAEPSQPFLEVLREYLRPIKQYKSF